MTLTWKGADGTTRYELKAIKTNDCKVDKTPEEQLKRTTETTYTFDLEANTDYWLCVRAVREIGSGSNQLTLRSAWAIEPGRTLAANRPPVPTNLRVRSVSGTGATLHWEGPAGISDFAVQLDGVDVDTSAGNVESIAFDAADGFKANTAHRLGVASVKNGVRSGFAELTLLLPPSNLNATTTHNSISLSWSLDARATKAEVRLGATGSVGDADARTSHTFDHGISPSTKYTVYVRAANAQGPSAWAQRSAETRARPVTPIVCPPLAQRPAAPKAGDSEELSRGKSWVVGADKATEILSVTSRTRSRTATWLGSPLCRWRTGEWSNWTTATATTNLRSLPRPPDRTRNHERPGETEWRVDEAKACKLQKYTIQPQRNRAVFSVPNDRWEFHQSGWTDDGTPRIEWRGPSSCLTRPVQRTRNHETPGGTAWRATSATACEWRAYTIQPQRNRAVFSVLSGRWQFQESGWTNVGSSSTTSRRTTTACRPKPADDVVAQRTQVTRQTRWVAPSVRDGIICSVEQSRQRYRLAYHRRPHVWGGSAWVDGQRNSAPFFTDPVFRYTTWQATGKLRPCPQFAREQGVGGQSESAAAQLPAGAYGLEWGDQWLSFTVPDGATVQLSGRLVSGVEAFVFITTGGAELVVTSQAPTQAKGLPTPSDPTLAVIAASSRLAEPAAPEPAAAQTECAVAGLSGSGPVRVDLDAEPCVIVRGGGPVTAGLGGATRSLTLPTGREWMLTATTGQDQASAIAVVDLSTGGYLVVKAADGSELTRSLGTGGAALGELFDAILPSESEDES